MASRVVLALALFASCSNGLVPSSPSSDLQSHRRSVVHERRDVDDNSPWIRRERMPQDDVIQMRIGLAQQNTHLGHELLMEVADPRSPRYGQHWSSEEVMKAFSPSDETINATASWITSTLGIDETSLSIGAGKGWLLFHALVEEVETLFGTEYWLYEHETDGRTAAGADHYSVPEDLAEHVDFVLPGVALGELRRAPEGGKRKRALKQRRQAAANATCAELITPPCIKELYGIPAADKAAENNSLGIFELDSFYQYEDLDIFFENYAPDIPQGSRPRNLSIDLATWYYDDPNNTSVTWPDEADLDIEVAWPIIYPQNITIFQVDDAYYNQYSPSTTGIFNTFLDALDGTYCNYSAYGETGDNPKYDPVYPNNNVVTVPGGGTLDPGTYKLPAMCGAYEPTNVISISYDTSEKAFTEAYQRRQCDEFLKLGLMGVSIIVASGDSGPQGSLACTANNLGSFSVQNPVNCPYVTSVGATQLLANGTEIAVQSDDWASSGGFSSFYARPSYQDDAVSTYFTNHNPTAIASKFNSSGRGVPDIAAVGENIAVAVNGVVSTSGGTSASAPLFAAMLNLVNEERLAAGKGTVGFVNPVLYANASRIFRDVTVGNNDVCHGLTQGFDAVPGWDPVTGLGTAQWDGLKEVFLDLP